MSSLVELVGISLISPFISVVLDQEEGNQNTSSLPNLLNSQFNFSGNEFILFFGLTVVLIYFLKMVVSIFALYKINGFSNFQIVRIRMLLMDSYLSLQYQKYQEKNSAEYVYSINDLARNFSLLVVKPILKMLSDTIIAISLIGFLIFSWIRSINHCPYSRLGYVFILFYF